MGVNLPPASPFQPIMHTHVRSTLLLALLAGASGFLPAGQGARESTSGAVEDAVLAAFREAGLELDLEHGVCAVPVTVQVRDDLLEFLLTGTQGSSHETLLTTEVRPSVLNAALLALGVEPGTNARWIERDPAPTLAERRAGISAFDVEPPAGGGFFLYLAWREGDETHFYRVEDLLRNLVTGRSMRRHRWVYLGSRMLPAREAGGPERFAADLEQNHINLALLSQGTTLVTAALQESQWQAIWLPNAWLLPERGTELHLYFARERLAVPPRRLADKLPAAPQQSPPETGAGDNTGQAGPPK